MSPALSCMSRSMVRSSSNRLGGKDSGPVPRRVGIYASQNQACASISRVGLIITHRDSSRGWQSLHMAFSIVRYSQQDPQWKDEALGSGPETIGHIGSGLTCMAMYASGWGLMETPATLNQKLQGAGGFIKQGLVWAALNKLYPQIKSTGLTVCHDLPAPLGRYPEFAGCGATDDRGSRFLSGGRPADTLDSPARKSAG